MLARASNWAVRLPADDFGAIPHGCARRSVIFPPCLGAFLSNFATAGPASTNPPSPSAKGPHTMKIRPLHDRLVVQRVPEEEKTTGGLFIPDSAKEKPARGVVIAVGEGKYDNDGKRISLDVKKGDEVLFGKYAGTELKLDGTEHIVLREEEILAVIES
jgi:chaperonin GroES